MNSKSSITKNPKMLSKSKKLFKSRNSSAKKSGSNRSPILPKRSQQKVYLSFYLSEQCTKILNPFANSQLYPKPLQTGSQDLNSLFSAMSTFKGQDTQVPFEENIEKMRFLTLSQEGLIERFLQDKYSFSKSSANLQEIYCYTTAKNLLQSQFQDFFLKRSEFLRQISNQDLNGMETLGENKNETFNENSFTTTNVSSPSINSSYGIFQGCFQYNEGYHLMNAKTNPEMMINILNENEVGCQQSFLYRDPANQKLGLLNFNNELNFYSTENKNEDAFSKNEEKAVFEEDQNQPIEKVRVEDLFLNI